MADMRYKENKDLLFRVKDRYRLMSEADYENRIYSLEDIRFVNVPGEQWESNMKQERGKRPCYEYNKTKIRCKRVINDMRDNRASGKVRAVEGGDKEIADIYEGLIRNIWNVSHGDNATDYAAEYQVEGGMGCWRVNTVYASDSAFDQDIVVESIENPLSLFCDPTAKEFMKRDAEDWVYTERLSYKVYEERYGKEVDKSNFEGESQFDTQDDDWIDEETVRVAEYWYKVPHKKELWLMETADEKGETKTTVVDSESDEAAALKKQGFKPKRTREVETHKIMMCVASGKEILEGPTEWAGHHFPWVMIFGEYKVIENEKFWWGLVRFAKDAQQNYNISKTAIAETIAQAPKTKFWATPSQAEGLTDQWAEAHKKNLPFQMYNPDPRAPGPPARMGAADIPIALMQQSALDDEDLKDVMGLPDASMGKQSGEKSGRAIYARQQQGEIATFNYKDNMSKGVEWTYEIIIDLIPEIYDTERELRVLGSDGKEAYKRVNQIVYDPDTNKAVRVNDLSTGKYDVTVTTGPAFATQRQEATEIYGAIMDKSPEIRSVAGDLIFKSMDLPYADEIGERLRTMLPPQIQQMLDQDVEVPPEIQQKMQQVNAMMEEAQKYGQLVQAANQELEEQKALDAKSKAEIKAEIANLGRAKAEFDMNVAQQLAKLVEKEAGITTKESQVVTKMAGLSEKAADLCDSETTDAVNTTQALDEILSSFMQAADQAMGVIDQKAIDLERKTDRKPTGGKIIRDGGRIRADVEYDDGSTKTLAAVREKGQLKIVPEADVGPEPAA